MKYKVNLYSHLNMLSGFIIVTASCLSFILFLFSSFNKGIAAFILFYLILYAIPVIVIHLDYYENNKQYIIEISEDLLLINVNNNISLFSSADIKEIMFYMTPSSLQNSSFRSLPFEKYYYVVITCLDGSSFYLTSLLSDKLAYMLELNFKDVLIKKQGTLYPIIIDKHG